MSNKVIRKYGVVFAAIIIMVFFLGCASMEKKYNDAKKLNTASAYEDFIKEYPTEAYTKEAKEKLNVLNEEMIFKKTELRNSIIGYKDFLQKYPQGQFNAEAKKRIAESDENAFIRTVRIGTDEAFQGFFESYPNSKYASEIKDFIQWKEKSKIGVILDIQSDAEDIKKEAIPLVSQR